jgi:pheromone shutdown protein TraB
MQKERGETMMTLFTRAMQVQANGKIDSEAMSGLDTFGLIRILMSQDSAAAFKKALAKMFDQTESLTAAMEGKDGSAALSGRNQVVVSKLATVLASRKQRHVAVFYGAAHMAGIESSLTNAMKAKTTGEEWLAAWTMPKVKPL